MRSPHVPNTYPLGSYVPNSGLRKEKLFLKGGKAPSEAVSGRATYSTVAAILYAGLAADVLGEKGCQ